MLHVEIPSFTAETDVFLVQKTFQCLSSSSRGWGRSALCCSLLINCLKLQTYHKVPSSLLTKPAQERLGSDYKLGVRHIVACPKPVISYSSGPQTSVVVEKLLKYVSEPLHTVCEALCEAMIWMLYCSVVLVEQHVWHVCIWHPNNKFLSCWLSWPSG